MTMIQAYEPGAYNRALAEALKKQTEFQIPEWALFVKTSTHKQRPTTEPDFWYKRAASILRQAYIQGIIGVNRLRTRYGGRKNRGMKPAQFRPAGGKMIRLLLQQAEQAGFLEKTKGKKAGRQLTAQGKAFLEGVKI
jgi:small subunit ribosomal protein S19e